MTSNVVNNAGRTPPLSPAVRVANSSSLRVSHNVRELWYLLRTSERFSPDIYRVHNTWYSTPYINTRYSLYPKNIRISVIYLKNILRDIRLRILSRSLCVLKIFWESNGGLPKLPKFFIDCGPELRHRRHWMLLNCQSGANTPLPIICVTP